MNTGITNCAAEAAFNPEDMKPAYNQKNRLPGNFKTRNSGNSISPKLTFYLAWDRTSKMVINHDLFILWGGLQSFVNLPLS